MKIVSINVATPVAAEYRGHQVLTGIFKKPVTGSVWIRKHNIDGDQQADLRVHGGPDKAVYVYPSEHYSDWQARLEVEALVWGAFGENLTTAGLIESEVRIGDRYRIGNAVLGVTQPRQPCYKLAIRFGRDDMIGLFNESDRPGFYCSVIQEGVVSAGDEIELVKTHPDGVTVSDVK